MNPAIHMFFSGLIVFSPHQESDLTFTMNTVLVNDSSHASVNPECDHVPTLRITGAAKVKKGSLCTLVTTMPQRQFLCFLDGKVRVKLVTERSRTKLPDKPPQPSVPANNTEADGGSVGWLVRMSNVEATAAKHKADIVSLGDATFSFGWSSANTCAFDVDDEKNADPMKFLEGAHQATHKQAAAEIVLFSSTVTVEKPTLTLDKGGAVTEVELDCSSGICPILEFSNNVQSDDCEIDHFPIYYGFSDGTVAHKVHPERISAEGVKASTVTFDCEAKINRNIRAAKGKLHTLAVNPLGIGPKPGDRLICPPVVMEE